MFTLIHALKPMVYGLVVQSTRGSQVQFPALPLCGDDLAQAVYTRASVTKQCKLVPINEQRYSMTGKVTVGLASHWPCFRDL